MEIDEAFNTGRHPVRTAIGWLAKQSKTLVIVFCIFLICLVAFIDYLTGEDLGVSLFYLIPIILVTLILGRNLGFAFAVTAVLIGFIADLFVPSRTISSAVTYWNAFTHLCFYIIIITLVARLQTALEHEITLSRTDPLTGVVNRRYFYELTTMQLDLARRYSHPIPISLAYVDLDNFKAVNDSLGHKTGDELLRLITRTISDNLRSVDILARLGGDEFTVLLPETDGVDAETVLLRVKEATLASMKERGLPVTLSIGIVTFTRLPESVEEMVTRADALMYCVKNSGKNDLKRETVAEAALTTS